MKIKKSFVLNPDNASSVVADAFGIQAGWENVIVDVDIPEPLPGVVLITGESGCGKSVLLNGLGSPNEFNHPDKPLHSWGKSDEESLRLLSSVGLNDASLFCLRYDALSDSQKARARMFYFLTLGSRRLIIDEFLSTLDRKTAVALAYSFQKLCRREQIQLIVATAHDDLGKYLRPDLILQGHAFPSRWDVESPTWETGNPFVDNLHIELWKDVAGPRTSSGGYTTDRVSNGRNLYRESTLATLHYKGKYLGGACDYMFASYDGVPVGVLVGAKARVPFLEEDTRGVRRIARVVVHPSYRGCGIGQRMIREYLASYPDKEVYTTAAMAKFNPVFLKAGMTFDGETKVNPPPALVKYLKSLNQTWDWQSRESCITLCSVIAVRQGLSKFASVFSNYYKPGGYLEEKFKERDREVIKREREACTVSAILTQPEIAGRLLWVLRPHSMARYKRPRTATVIYGTQNS